MEAGVGRLLLPAERSQWPRGPVRSAFAIGDGYVLTAWHCVRDIGGQSARLWLRLRAGEQSDSYVDIPVRHSATDPDPELDVTLLEFDDTLGNPKLRRHLDDVALPLGVEVDAHDEVRIGGFPAWNPARHCVMLGGKVDSADAPFGEVETVRVHVPAMAARHPETPHGMSGGPLLRTGPDRLERVVGLVRAFPRAQGDAALGGEVLCCRIRDVRRVFAPVDDAVRRGATGAGAGLDDAIQYSDDVLEASWPALRAAGLQWPARWDAEHLLELRRRFDAEHPGPSRARDTIAALHEGIRAKVVLSAIGGAGLQLGNLMVLYDQEVGDCFGCPSADALLVRAADADQQQRRRNAMGPLGALARFVISAAAVLGADPAQHGVLRSWLSSLGHQLADAKELYAHRRTSGAWLLLDFGDEDPTESAAWPTAVTWNYIGANGTDAADRVECDGTEEALRRALRQILRVVPPAFPLLVDLALPHGKLRTGIEHWDIREVDRETRTLSDDCHPRLRWSRRLHNGEQRRRLKDHTARVRWDTEPPTLVDEVLADHVRLKDWTRSARHHTWLLGGCVAPDPARTDPLWVLLREGHGFVVWFPERLDPDRRQQIGQAVAGLSVPTRRNLIPDRLPTFDGFSPTVIWDDPDGRGLFKLAPRPAGEAIQDRSM
jgi:hypothetical protein